jgi:hypothetical protein
MVYKSYNTNNIKPRVGKWDQINALYKKNRLNKKKDLAIKKQQILAVNKKVRASFYKIMAEGKDVHAFNIEWAKLARDFAKNKYTLKEYEKEVNNLVNKWS